MESKNVWKKAKKYIFEGKQWKIFEGKQKIFEWILKESKKKRKKAKKYLKESKKKIAGKQKPLKESKIIWRKVKALEGKQSHF